MDKQLHPKIKELQLRAAPVTYSNMSVDAKGEVVDDRRIKGYLIVWGVKDDYGTVFVKGCCSKSLQERGPNSDSKYKITFLWQHKLDDPLCVFDVLKEDDYGLYFEAVPDDVPSGDRVVTQVRSKTINQFSVGFDYIWDKTEWDDNAEAIVLKEIALWEGSAVTIGSNTETYAIRSAADYEEKALLLKEETEDFIKSLPRSKQYEARQILTRNMSLAKLEPHAKLDALKPNEPVSEEIDYNFLTQNLKIFQ